MVLMRSFVTALLITALVLISTSAMSAEQDSLITFAQSLKSLKGKVIKTQFPETIKRGLFQHLSKDQTLTITDYNVVKRIKGQFAFYSLDLTVNTGNQNRTLTTDLYFSEGAAEKTLKDDSLSFTLPVFSNENPVQPEDLHAEKIEYIFDAKTLKIESVNAISEDNDDPFHMHASETSVPLQIVSK